MYAWIVVSVLVATPPASPPAAPAPVVAVSSPGAPEAFGSKSLAKAWPSSPPSAGLFLALATIALLAISAALSFRRKIGRGRLIEVIEMASLGPKRSLVVARISDQTLVLGVSEAGICLLSSPMQPLEVPERSPLTSSKSNFSAAKILSFWQRKKEARPARKPGLHVAHSAYSMTLDNFAAQLDVAAEDQELRQKIKARKAERIP